MQIHHQISELLHLQHPIVTIGTFDGVHRGHQQVLQTMVSLARQQKTESVVITFIPHPRIVLYGKNQLVKMINTQEKKEQLLSQSGVDHLLILHFTPEFSQLSPEQFFAEYLSKIDIGTLVIGYDHHFGNHRKGGIDNIKNLQRKYDFNIIEVKETAFEGMHVSSTVIREALNNGEVALANRMLGYEYSLTGIVVHGNQNGRLMGFPTANLAIEDQYKIIAANGVYANHVWIDEKCYNGMSNIGFRPTINDGRFSIEVHIFDFNEDIYGKTISVSFIERIRNEIKFKNLEDLKAQLQQDMTLIQQRFSKK
ncbi:MAG: bifunctional riboflavin kinase/FAD synthetase [Bacteroidales bacterium]|nr:bifunctional riboflavin kinase/FAD synthetase [Bacteroidales bacterium]